MDQTAVKDLIIEAIYNDAELAEWLGLLYGRAQLVMDGLDERDIPDEEELPAVIVLVPGKEVGREVNNDNEYFFQIVCMLADPEFTLTP